MKEVWRMTPNEYIKFMRKSYKFFRTKRGRSEGHLRLLRLQHEKLVSDAYKKGEYIPPHVTRHYPYLTTRSYGLTNRIMNRSTLKQLAQKRDVPYEGIKKVLAHYQKLIRTAIRYGNIKEANRLREEWKMLRRNSISSSIRIPGKVLVWREHQRKGSIMKPSTFKSIKRKGAARYKKQGVGKKVAGKAYQVTLLKRYLDAHPGDKYVEGVLRRLVRRKYGKKIGGNPRVKWYVGTAKDTGALYRFRSPTKPTRRTHGRLYSYVTGPFKSEREALIYERKWQRHDL